MEQFPPNSKRSRERDPVERVVSGEAVRKKPSLGKQFRQTFIGGDARTAGEYMLFEVGVPLMRDFLFETIQSGFERYVYGVTSRRRRGMPSGPNPYGHVDYQSKSRHLDDRPPLPTQQKMLSRQAKARFDFDEIILATRQDAEEVLDRMYDILAHWDEVSVSDFYSLAGLTPTHVDKKWGWNNLTGAGIGRVRGGGYVLDLPEPEYLG